MLRLDIDGFTEDEVIGFILTGLEQRRDSLVQTISNLQAKIGGRTPAASAAPVKPEKKVSKRQISPEGRARIAAAQRRRWRATHKAANAAKAAPAPRKRRARINLVPLEDVVEASA